MRTLYLATVAALALCACSPRADTATTIDNTSMASNDNMTVPADETTANEAMGGPGMTAPMTTDNFVATAAMSDKYEISAGKIAATRASDAAVKRFAQQMVDAHTGTTAALKAATGKDGVPLTPPAALDAKHQALIQSLIAAEPANFDEIYKAQQRDAHTEALALMQGYSANGDKPAVRSFASETAPKVQMHMDMLSKLK